TGLQYSRDISMGGDSPQISFHAVMSNTSDHPIRWSMQSVTQYDTADSRNAANYNPDFWAFAPVNPHSAYTDGYRVRNGLGDDPIGSGQFLCSGYVVVPGSRRQRAYIGRACGSH